MNQPVTEITRPLVHFTPAKNWINDPNGLVYLDGEYHLFYQYNPQGDTWGHMSWGHAVSRDLVQWTHLPVALSEASDHMIYSGSAVVDWNNTSGFGQNSLPPLVAIYTAHYTNQPLQKQHIAYSNDKGRTWTAYAGNPVLDIGDADFRDPKVFWHESSGRWIMVVSLSVRKQLSMYASRDLKNWLHLSDFGPVGCVDGIWECPDLFPLLVEQNSGQEKWVLLLNINPGHPAGGSGCQYFVGHFDGTRFVSESDEVLWVDHGPDFYAAVSWSDIPANDGRRIILGWMNNWIYAGKTPTSPWRGMMSIPRVASLKKTSHGYRLIQTPVAELLPYRSVDEYRWYRDSLSGASDWLNKQGPFGPAVVVDCTFENVKPDQRITIAVEAGPGEIVNTSFDFKTGRVTVDRTQAGNTSFADTFAAAHSALFDSAAGHLSLQLLLDVNSLELFIQGGETVISEQLFFTAHHRRFSVNAEQPSSETVTIELHPLGLSKRQ